MILPGKRAAAMLAGAGLLLAGCVASAGDHAHDIAIVGVTLVSPERASPLADAAIYITGDRIDLIEAGAPRRAARRVIEADGLFATPGLIDSHVHVAASIGPAPTQARAAPELIADQRRQTPRSYLYFGFTALIDPDLDPETRTWFEAVEHPTLHGCARGVRMLDGYGMNFVRPEDRLTAFPNFVLEPAQAADPPEGVDPADHTPQAAVARVVRDGGVCVKTYFERGFSGVFDLPAPSTEVLAEVARAAHDRGLPVLLHATSLEAYAVGVDMGADILAHGLWHWPGPLTAEPPPEAAAVLDRLAASGVAVQPTLQVLYGEEAVITGEALRDPRLREVLSPSLSAYFTTPQADWYREELAELYEAAAPDSGMSDAEAISIFIQRARRAVAELVRRGAPILFGSDTPASPGAGNPHGLNGHYEILRLHEAGVPLEDLFQALTLRNAQAFGLEADIGSLEPGKRADILLLTDDPRRTVAAYDGIHAVVIGGRVLPRSCLAADAVSPC